MIKRLTVGEILEAAKALPPSEKLQLIAALSGGQAEPRRRVTRLRGLGKELWHGCEVQDYVNG